MVTTENTVQAKSIKTIKTLASVPSFARLASFWLGKTST